MTIRELGENLEQYFLDLLKEKRHGFGDRIVMGLLFLFSRVYRNVVQLRLWMYENLVIRNRAIGCLVISIGNLTCGGTMQYISKFGLESHLAKIGRYEEKTKYLDKLLGRITFVLQTSPQNREINEYKSQVVSMLKALPK